MADGPVVDTNLTPPCYIPTCWVPYTTDDISCNLQQGVDETQEKKQRDAERSRKFISHKGTRR